MTARDGAFGIAVDREACAGSGECVARAPHTFGLDATGRARVVDAAGDPEDAVRDAARRCPRFAIAVRRGGRPGA